MDAPHETEIDVIVEPVFVSVPGVEGARRVAAPGARARGCRERRLAGAVAGGVVRVDRERVGGSAGQAGEGGGRHERRAGRAPVAVEAVAGDADVVRRGRPGDRDARLGRRALDEAERGRRREYVGRAAAAAAATAAARAGVGRGRGRDPAGAAALVVGVDAEAVRAAAREAGEGDGHRGHVEDEGAVGVDAVAGRAAGGRGPAERHARGRAAGHEEGSGSARSGCSGGSRARDLREIPAERDDGAGSRRDPEIERRIGSGVGDTGAPGVPARCLLAQRQQGEDARALGVAAAKHPQLQGRLHPDDDVVDEAAAGEADRSCRSR